MGRVPGEAVAARHRPRRTDPRLCQSEQRTAGLGTAGQPSDRCPAWRSRGLACRRRHRPPRRPTNRSKATADRGRPVATEPRPRSCPMRPARWRRRRETPGWWTLSRSPAQRSTSYASNTCCSSEWPARAAPVSAIVSSKDVADQRLRQARSDGVDEELGPYMTARGAARP